MKFTDRVKSALTAFSKTDNSVGSNPAADFLRYGNRHQPMLQDWSQVEMSDQDMYTGYSYAAINKRANRAAILGKKYLVTTGSQAVMDAAKKKEETLVHPYLKLIRESKEFTEKKFWHDISTYLDLEGIYYLMAVRATTVTKSGETKVGAVQKFVMMNPYQVKRVRREADGSIGGYIESKDGMYREIPKEMVIEIRLLNPFDNDEPFSMTDAAKESQFTMKQAGDYTRHSIKGNINAPGAITTDVVLEDQIFDNFVSRIKNHSKGEPLYGNGAGAINWQSMQVDLDKASLDKINEIHRSTLFAVSGVSKTAMGIEESGTGREVSKTQKDDFTENAVMPQVEDIIDALNLDYRKWYPEWEKDKYEIILDNPLESDRDSELKDIEIRDREYAMTDQLVQMGYEYDIAAKYAHGEITLLELGLPTLEPELTEEEADMLAMKELGLTSPTIGDAEPQPEATPGVLPAEKTEEDQESRLNAVLATNEIGEAAPRPRRYVTHEENEKRLKTAIERAKKRMKDSTAGPQKLLGDAGVEAALKKDGVMDVDAKYTSIKPLVDGSVSIIFRTTPVDEAKMTELLYYYRKEGKLSFVAEDGQPIQVATEEEAENAIRQHLVLNDIKTVATNQISSKDYPDLYKDLDIDFDDLGCIMLDTVKIPVTQYVKNFNPDDLFDQERYDQGSVVGETKPHVTLLFGLLENGNKWKDKVDMLLEGWELPTVTIQEVSYFDVGDSYAVIALLERTPELVDGHERLSLLPHINTFSEYHPHITLAYIKKDADVDNWVNSLSRKYKGQKVATTNINYGDLPEDEEAENSLEFSKSGDLLDLAQITDEEMIAAGYVLGNNGEWVAGPDYEPTAPDTIAVNGRLVAAYNSRGYNPYRDAKTGRFDFGPSGDSKSSGSTGLMSRSEAEKAVKDSAYKGVLYHGTTGENAAKIAKEGFKIPEKARTGSMYGNAVYLSENIFVAQSYAPGEDGQKVAAYIDVKNPYVDLDGKNGKMTKLAFDYGVKNNMWSEKASINLSFEEGAENIKVADFHQATEAVANELLKEHDALILGAGRSQMVVVRDPSAIKPFKLKGIEDTDEE